MPDLGAPVVREARRLARAYRSFPGPETAPASEVLAWYEANDSASETNVRAALERGEAGSIERREFLRWSAVAGAGALGASLLWKPSIASAADRNAKVVVVGAGLAGLTCTYRLRRMGIRRRAARGAGPRRRTMPVAPRVLRRERRPPSKAGSSSTRGTATSAISPPSSALPLVDSFAAVVPQRLEGATGGSTARCAPTTRSSPTSASCSAGSNATTSASGSYVWNEAGPAAKAIDRVTVIEWLDDNIPGGSDSLLGRWAGVFMQGFFGMEPGEMSMINLFEGLVVPYPGADERYRVSRWQRPCRARDERALPAQRRPHDGQRAAGRADPFGRTRSRCASPTEPYTRRGRRPGRVRAAVHDAARRRPVRPVAVAPQARGDRRARDGHEREAQHAVRSPVRAVRLERRVLERRAAVRHVGHDVRPDTTPRTANPVLTVYNGGREGASYPTDVGHGPA